MILAEVATGVAGPGGWDRFDVILPVIGTLIVALLGYLGIKKKASTEAQASRDELNQGRLETLIKGLSDRVEKLETKVTELERENFALEDERDQLLARNRTHEDLIYGFTSWHLDALSQWEEGGGPPIARPPYPWQVRQHLAHARLQN